MKRKELVKICWVWQCGTWEEGRGSVCLGPTTTSLQMTKLPYQLTKFKLNGALPCCPFLEKISEASNSYFGHCIACVISAIIYQNSKIIDILLVKIVW